MLSLEEAAGAASVAAGFVAGGAGGAAGVAASSVAGGAGGAGGSAAACGGFPASDDDMCGAAACTTIFKLPVWIHMIVL